MPDDPTDPIEALRTIRTLAMVTLEAEVKDETPEAEAKRAVEHLRMILALCDKALPVKRSSRRTWTPPKPGEV